MTLNKLESRDSEMVLSMSFVPLLVVNALTLFVANAFFPEFVVLGTVNLSPSMGLFLSMAVLAMVNTLIIPVVWGFEQSRNKLFDSSEWMLVYFLVNFISLWLITRVPEKLGLGVSSWTVLALMSLILDFVQGAAMMKVEEWRRKSS